MPYYAPYQTGYVQPYQQSYLTPVYQQMPQQMPQQAQQAQPQQAQMPTANSIIWVSGEKEAAMYPIAPNNAVTLWSQSEPVVYLKQADASGKPTMKVYDLVERTETPSSASPSKPVKSVSYASADDLATVVGAVRGVNEAISSIRAEIDTIKGDVYGLAGKKRTVKPQEGKSDE